MCEMPLISLEQLNLTDDVQADEGFSFSMSVLDDHFITTLVRLLGVLEPVLCLLTRCVDVFFGQTLVVIKPVCLSLRVSAVRHRHGDGLPDICDILLVCGLYLRHSCRRRTII